jgi:hypothetical protein
LHHPPRSFSQKTIVHFWFEFIAATMLRTRAHYSPLIRFLREESSCRSLSGLIKQKFDQGRTQEYKTDGVTSDGTSRIQKVLKEEDAKEKSLQFIKTVVNYLLPKGYPGSVRSGYERFAVGQFTSNTLSTAAGVLSMQALLYAMGIGMGTVGMNTAPLAATLNWVIKDGLGQLGGVVFASFVNNRFDADPKRWRLTATIAMDAASFIEMLTPLVPGYFLAVASIANVSKNISFLAASASRAAIHRSFTLQENLADVTAKTGSQFIVSSLLGTSLGVSLSGLVAWGVTGADAQYASTVGMYCALSSVSIAVTYWSLRHATITSLSPARLDYVLHTYLLPLLHPDPSAEPSTLGRDYWRDRQLLSPEQLRQAEAHLGVPALMVPIGHGGADVAVRLPNLRVGCDLDEVVADRDELQARPQKALKLASLKLIILTIVMCVWIGLCRCYWTSTRANSSS